MSNVQNNKKTNGENDLRQEELRKILLECVMKYGFLEKRQLVRFASLLGYNSEIVSTAINSIMKEKILFMNENDDISLTPNTLKSHSTIDAFWVLCEFAKVIDPQNHFKAQYPSDIFFIRDKSQYEIMVPKPGDEFLINIIKEKNSVLREEDKIKLIVVVEDENQLNAAIPYTSDINIMFAQILNKDKEYPSVNFIML